MSPTRVLCACCLTSARACPASEGCSRVACLFFFFQAEDGIRDVAVTGVQTCALPICAVPGAGGVLAVRLGARPGDPEAAGARGPRGGGAETAAIPAHAGRAAGHAHLRRDERLPGRRRRPGHQGLGAGLPRLHDGAAPGDRRRDPDPQGVHRRPHRAAAGGDRRVQEDRGALMAKPLELRRRIRSVQSTRKITKTMELVATSKLKRAQDRVAAARPYAAALTEVMGDLYDPELAERFPLLRQPPEGGEGPARRVALLLITSNRGLCGAFNANLIREARRRLDELDRAGTPVDLHVVGKKGITYFRFAKRPLASQRTDIGDKPTATHAAELVGPLVAQFASGGVDAVEVVFAQFRSAVSTPPTTLRILPVTPPRARSEEHTSELQSRLHLVCRLLLEKK